MNSRLIYVLIGLCTSLSIYGQKNLAPANPWKMKSTTQTIDEQRFTTSSSQKNSYFFLDTDLLKTTLSTLISDPTETQQEETKNILLPRPDGTFQEFEIHATQTMHPGLAAKYPSIKTYAGRSVVSAAVTMRADLSEHGFHAMIFDEQNGSSLIEPAKDNDRSEYVVFYKKDSPANMDWGCHAHEVNEIETAATAPPQLNRNPDCKLRTYRIALACTGEYAQYHGGSISSALAAMATTLNRVNGIFERDLGVHLEMVENNDEIIYLLPHADPFSNSDGAAMLGENQTVCDAVIGSENYDVGHVFSTAGGGIALVGSACNENSKAGGVTGSPYPEGNAFDIDYVAHELGHQFGANHTQNNPCNRNAATSVEPGSGSTIMSYAGVCSPNIQLNSDTYFHAISIGEIKNHLSGNGNNCAILSGGNNCPTADAGPDYVIPHSTPFVLTGLGNDIDPGDDLTYCWEQMDNQAAVMPPFSGNNTGPAFRSLPPKEAAQRFFPNLNAYLNEATNIWEVLPSQNRTLNFVLTVRDNHPHGGCIAQDDLRLTVKTHAGPFRVEQPTTWVSGQTQTITWDVANTNQAPINCAFVDISLSVDGGKTWPHFVATATNNDGAHEITVPNLPTTEARIMVKSNSNVFYAVSKNNFTIAESAELSVNLNTTHTSCFGEKDGSISATPSGGEGNYHFLWSNGKEGKTIAGLDAGEYSVTVTSGPEHIVKSVKIHQPEPLVVSISGNDASLGSNGNAAAEVDGGTGQVNFQWQDGSTEPDLKHLTAGEYAVTVSDQNGCTASASITLEGTPPLPLEYGVVENVSESWQVVQLKNEYERMVVVTTLELPQKGTASVVTRIRGAKGSQFELKLQRAGESDYPLQTTKVHYLVAEEGHYPASQYGVNFEARRVKSAFTSGKGNWKFQPQSFLNDYNLPVVLGQVMSFHDHKWSVFWSSRNNKRNHPPTHNSFSIGKHAGQDSRPHPGPADELGYFVFESGAGYINGKRFLAAVGKDKVRGLADAEYGYTYAFNGFSETKLAIVSAAGIDGDEGAWPVLSDNTPTSSTISLFAMEDQCHDDERFHSSEQMAYLIFGKEDPELTDVQSEKEAASERPDPESYLNAFPSPSSGTLNLEFYQVEAGGPEVVICDLFGRVRRQFTLLHSQPGLREVQLDLSNLSPGTYLLQIWEGKTRKIIKIVLL